MTIEEVQKRVAEIEANDGDDEAQHGAEDALHQEVMAYIAEGSGEAAELCREALRTKKLEFARWYA